MLWAALGATAIARAEPPPAPSPDGEPTAEAAADEPEAELSLDEIDQQLNNPLSRIWSLTFQENFNRLDGDLVDERTYSSRFFFQPFLPIPVADRYIFVARPVFPLVTSPRLDAETARVDGHETGFGDMQLLSLFGPDRSRGVVWGAGATLKFPTATADELGEGKWQAGPGMMLFNFTQKWSLGLLAQHWWSFAGDDGRPGTSQSDIQYVIRRGFPNAWSLGMGPTVSIDWTADHGDKVTFPVGLGVTKTLRIAGVPFKMRVEPQYSVVRPDSVGTEWNLRIQITPVIPSPFAK